jgi:glutathione S-transferase
VAHWLDDQYPGATAFSPADPVQAFIAALIDEAFDEYGLYMVHHQRWVCSAEDTAMGEVTAAEFSRLLFPPFTNRIRRDMPRRQVRRCPYLFSVAPEGYKANVEPLRVPPSRPGFPQTHTLLAQSWYAFLAAMESVLTAQPYLLGDRFTLADASAYGQLSMNLIDPTSVADLQQRAPVTHRWLLNIRDGKIQRSGEIKLTAALQPLLDIIMQTFAPLMVQNEAAYQRALGSGASVFNEAAFDRNLSLYDGELLGHPFRSVVKTFQVRVWQDLCQRWRQLHAEDKDVLLEMLPDAGLFESSSEA